MCQINIVPSSARIALPSVERDEVSKLFCIVWNTKMVERVKIFCRTDCIVTWSEQFTVGCWTSEKCQHVITRDT